MFMNCRGSGKVLYFLPTSDVAQSVTGMFVVGADVEAGNTVGRRTSGQLFAKSNQII